ncbi:MAG: TonB family protein [Fibrobacter sp.]|nr:TonB family protein [Fibrobacter sp.]
MKTKTPNQDALVASLMPDSDKKMVRIAGVSLLVAIVLCFWAAAYEVVVDDFFIEPTNTPEIKATMNIIDKKEEKRVDKKPEHKPRETPRRRPGGGGKSIGKGNPRAPLNRGVIRALEAQTANASAAAYDLLTQKFSKDIDKVLKNTNGLQVTGKTKIGEVRGKVDGGFNQGMFAGGSGGIGNDISNLIGGPAGAISTKAMGNIKPPKDNEIEWGSGPASRSAADIMKVVRQRTPGLRHVYNKHLKKVPGFQGKVTLKFTIAPGGEIISIATVSSTTGNSEFDNEIKNTVGRWKFSKVKSGNTTVTIPFTFTE